MGRKPGENEAEKSAAWFALELAERKQEIEQIYCDLDDALKDGMLGMAQAQAVALSLHSQDLSRALAARPPTIIDAATLN